MKVIKLTNKDDGFYPTMGPFLANRQIEKDIGYKLYDDDGKMWFLAVDDGVVSGFCYRWERSKDHYDIGSCYAPENGNVFSKLIRAACVRVKGIITITTKKEQLVSVLKKEGFSVKREMKNFVEYVKEKK